VPDLEDIDHQPIVLDGYNVGVNVGQTVMHLHVHVIPRYEGDVADPRGRGRSRRRGCIERTAPGAGKNQEKAVFPAAGEVELPGSKRRRSILSWLGQGLPGVL